MEPVGLMLEGLASQTESAEPGGRMFSVFAPASLMKNRFVPNPLKREPAEHSVIPLWTRRLIPPPSRGVLLLSVRTGLIPPTQTDGKHVEVLW